MDRSTGKFFLESLQRGHQIGGYTLLEPIGQGGEAMVWSGWEAREMRVVALKIVALAGEGPYPASMISKDFRRQVHLLASLDHPNILPLYEFGESDEYFYFVTRYSSAGSLANRLVKGPLPLDESLRLWAQICRALEHIHDRGIIHRDIKPSNILMDWWGRAYLSDFGLARQLVSETMPLHTGRGTGPYAPYEQYALSSALPQSDIYSLGIMIYEMLAGKLPWDGTESLAMRQEQMFDDLPDPRQANPSIPDSLVDVLRRMTAFHPVNRPGSVREAFAMLVDALRDTNLDLANLTETGPGLSDEELLVKDAQYMLDVFVREWQPDQHEFPARLTHLAVIDAAINQDPSLSQSLDGAQLYFMLRGALAYDYRLDAWWRRAQDGQERLRACAETILLESNEGAIERALFHLSETTSEQNPPKETSEALSERLVEVATGSGGWAARQDALTVLERLAPRFHQWGENGFSEAADRKLARLALEDSSLAVQAARLIGQVRSQAAVRALLEGQDNEVGTRSVLTVLKEVYTAAGSLPAFVPPRLRMRTAALDLRDRLREDRGRFSPSRFLIGLAAGTLVSLIMLLGFFWRQNAQLQDALLEPYPVSGIVTIIAVDDASLARYGRWDSWPRSLHADLIDRLEEAGAKAIVFDFLFDLQADQDAQLVIAMQRAGNVVNPALGQGDAHLDVQGTVRFDEMILPRADLLEASAGLGHANVLHDPDGYVRRSPTTILVDRERFPSLALAALGAYLGIDARLDWPEDGLLQFLGREIPVGQWGDLTIYFAGPPAQEGKTTFLTVSYQDVLDGLVSPEAFRDKVVLVGMTATAEPDRYLTPVSRGRPMYGVEILANTIEAIWSEQFIIHPGTAALALILLGLGILTSLVCVRPWSGLLLAVGLCVLYFLFVSWLFDMSGIMLDLFYPFMAIGLSYVLVVTYRYSIENRNRRKVVQLLERRVTPETAQATAQAVQRGLINLEGRVQEVTVLVVDLRVASNYVHQFAPEAILETMDHYGEMAYQAVMNQEGTVTKREGEQMIAFFNAPLPQEDHVRRAVKAALDLRDRVMAYQGSLPPGRSEGKIDLGYGISTGRAIVGCAGAPPASEYSVMGSAVFIAAQLSSMAKAGQILLDAPTYEKTAETVHAELITTVRDREGGRHREVYEAKVG